MTIKLCWSQLYELTGSCYVQYIVLCFLELGVKKNVINNEEEMKYLARFGTVCNPKLKNGQHF